MSATLPVMTDEPPTLEQRVAALEEALLYPLRTIQAPPCDLTDEQAAELRRELDAVLKDGPHEYRILPPPPPLAPDEVRQLLRECVTVVKPGEVLILRGSDGMTPQHVRAIHEVVSAWLEHNAPDIRAIVVPLMEIAVMPAGEAGAMTRGGFLNDCRIDTFRDSARASFRITHLPTGVKAEGGWDEAVAELGRELIQRGDITVNDARAAMGLRPLEHLDGEDGGG